MRGINLGLHEQRVCVQVGRRNYPCVLWVEARGIVQDYTKNFDEPADYKRPKGQLQPSEQGFWPYPNFKKTPKITG